MCALILNTKKHSSLSSLPNQGLNQMKSPRHSVGYMVWSFDLYSHTGAPYIEYVITVTDARVRGSNGWPIAFVTATDTKQFACLQLIQGGHPEIVSPPHGDAHINVPVQGQSMATLPGPSVNTPNS